MYISLADKDRIVLKCSKKDTNKKNLIFYQEVKDLDLIIKNLYYLDMNMFEINQNLKQIEKNDDSTDC